ncbi:hypothetical protein TYRP_010668 [Tyrophagus putrescentiae]|nr:hypothetical protein TYRP_010668 [Tyrophagus putrescentiae]
MVKLEAPFVAAPIAGSEVCLLGSVERTVKADTFPRSGVPNTDRCSCLGRVRILLPTAAEAGVKQLAFAFTSSPVILMVCFGRSTVVAMSMISRLKVTGVCCMSCVGVCMPGECAGAGAGCHRLRAH